MKINWVNKGREKVNSLHFLCCSHKVKIAEMKSAVDVAERIFHFIFTVHVTSAPCAVRQNRTQQKKTE